VFVWIDGSVQSQISVADRSVQYGDGFFTTLLVLPPYLYNWSAHWWRLQTSAAKLGFRPLQEKVLRDQIKAAYLAFIASQASHERSYPLAMKLIISRGEGGKGYQPPLTQTPVVMIQVLSHPSFEQACEGAELAFPITLGVCQTQCSIQPQLAGLKHLNRLENVLARNELHHSDLTDCIMLNATSEVVCSTQANVFLIRGDQLITPKLIHSGVAGTTRFQMPQIAKSVGLRYCEQSVSLDEMMTADELFLTNALRGIMPVGWFQQKAFLSLQTQAIHEAWWFWQTQHKQRIDAQS